VLAGGFGSAPHPVTGSGHLIHTGSLYDTAQPVQWPLPLLLTLLLTLLLLLLLLLLLTLLLVLLLQVLSWMQP
jgi:hypothetical protein